MMLLSGGASCGRITDHVKFYYLLRGQEKQGLAEGARNWRFCVFSTFLGPGK